MRHHADDHIIVFAAYDGIQALDLVGPLEVFSGANAALAEYHPERPRYHTTVASVGGGTVTADSGLSIDTEHLASVGRADTVLVPGGFAAPAAADDADIVSAIARLGRHPARVLSVCTGTFVVAAAGLASGRRVCTHWAYADELRRRFPDVEVDADPIYIDDGRLWSSAGVTAGIDLALAVVERDHGGELAQIVARWLVMFLRRAGGQSQFAVPVWSERAQVAPVRAAQDLIDAEPGADHRVRVLAARVGMSERHFARRFSEEVGLSPAQYVAAVRVEAARRSLESTGQTISTIARRCGFGTAESMRRTFRKHLGVSPDHYRRRFQLRDRPTTSI